MQRRGARDDPQLRIEHAGREGDVDVVGVAGQGCHQALGVSRAGIVQRFLQRRVLGQNGHFEVAPARLRRPGLVDSNDFLVLQHQLPDHALAHPAQAANDVVVGELVEHASQCYLLEPVENLKPDQDVDQHADSYEDNAESGNDQDRIEVAPVLAEFYRLLVPDRGQSYERHIEAVEPALALDQPKAHRAACQRAGSYGDQYLDPGGRGLPPSDHHQRLRRTSIVMSSCRVESPVQRTTSSITSSITDCSAWSARWLTARRSRSSPYSSPWAFSGSVTPSV